MYDPEQGVDARKRRSDVFFNLLKEY